ncbi:adenylate cyclase type 3 isoform X2 [Stigmatopora nigra]
MANRVCHLDTMAQPPTLSPDSSEKLYQSYFRRQRRRGVPTLLLFAALFNGFVVVTAAAAFDPRQAATLAAAAVGLLADAAFHQLYRRRRLPAWPAWRGAVRVAVRGAVPYLLWLTVSLHVLCYVGLRFGHASQAGDALGWQAFFSFCLFLTLPLKLPILLLLSGISCGIHVLLLGVTVARTSAATAEEDLDGPMLVRQLLANVMLYLCAAAAGWLWYRMSDGKYRTAFLEARQSLEVKITLEEQSTQQEELLLSILPKHIADEMLRGLKDQADPERPRQPLQFNTMYMYRHEHVSILFADIVGFTQLSSSCSAQELVKLLNQLFARFDKLAERHHQLRIKILGDCYYCICGLPDFRQDHAACSIAMGLSMVEAISYVREKTKTDVDMRVGVHTGTVLGGVLGQKRWQFDVWSTDVTVANKMESGGIPGRVHISHSTKESLHGEFELEPGNGGDRCEYLLDKGVATYLVVVPKRTAPRPSPEVSALDGGPLPEITPFRIVFSQESAVLPTGTSRLLMEAPESPSGREGCRSLAEHVINARLQRELRERETQQILKNVIRPVWLSFVDGELEAHFSSEKEKRGAAALACCALLLLFVTAMEVFIDPLLTVNYVTLAIGEVLLLILSACSAAAFYPRFFSKKLVSFSLWLDRTRWARNTWAAAAIFVITMALIADMLSCVPPRRQAVNGTPAPLGRCAQNPKHYGSMAVAALMATAVLVQVGHLIKLGLMALVVAATGAVNIHGWRETYDYYDFVHFTSHGTATVPSKYLMTATTAVMMLCLYLFSRHSERQSRELFLWKVGVHRQKEKVLEMRRWNQALVANMLPEHVAKHFLGAKKRDEELYSQAYQEAGVMFASIPNFSDFYTEESINNGGIECLRILNEIISDFDALLDKEQFRHITKIKTIGSTYMAASGLAPKSHAKVHLPGTTEWSEKSVASDWRHLADLADFSLAMKVTLDNLNKQSFNNFMLRIGVNKGAVLAGVIGARKPHYDIWGNTVNVASRMESTGVMGNIQVVEDCYHILKDYDFRFVRRGPIFVKGKGELLTFFMKGKGPAKENASRLLPTTTLPHQVVRVSSPQDP